MSSVTVVADFLEPPEKDGELGRLGPYRVIGVLGRGGMGQVFRAEDTRLQRTVALKVMNKRFASTPHSRQRFIDEARSMAAVHHDNVATIFEVGQKDNTPFMAMELLQGQTLEQLTVSGRRFSPDEIIEIATQVASGLAAAHARGITHRDIKPANLWVQTPGERIKILDFGLALAGVGVDRLSEVGSVVGTPGYLSPEQARNEPVDDRTDLYALGVVMYELATGRLPLLAKNVATHLITIICHAPAPVQQLAPMVPAPLAELIMRLLAKEPRDRIATAPQLLAALKEAQERLADHQQKSLDIVVAPEQPKSRRLRSVEQSEVEEAAGTGTTRRASRPAWIWISAAGGVLILTLGIFLALHRRRVAQTPMVIPPTTTREAPAPKITSMQLDPLRLIGDVDGSSAAPVGQTVRYNIQLTNQATSAGDDPRLAHRDAKQVARLLTFLQLDDQPRRRADAFPLLLSPRQLPGPGQTQTLTVQLPTAKLARGTYAVTFELQTPDGSTVHSIGTKLTVEENLLEGELLGFQTSRTYFGSGADTSIRPGETKPLGQQGFVEILRQPNAQTHLVLRFDLSQIEPGGDRANVDRAVLLLTVAKDSLPERVVAMVYGWPESLPGQNPSASAWKETGPDSLLWKNAPSRGGTNSLTYLGQMTIDNVASGWVDQADRARLASPQLDEFLRNRASSVVSLVIVRETMGAKSTRFVSRQGNKPERAPGLAIRWTDGKASP